MNADGLLIAIEGIDGCGKSTLARELYAQLQAHGHNVLLTKEPGSTPLGITIRGIVQQQPVPVCSKAEYLLFAADRAQHMAQLIGPALRDHKIVISDRMGDSSVAYQGYARGLDIAMIKQINGWALSDRHPDVTIFVHLDPEIALQRCITRKEKLTAFEKEGVSFMRKLHDGFCALYKERTDVIIIDGNQSPTCMINDAYKALLPWLEKHANSTHATSPTVARLT